MGHLKPRCDGLGPVERALGVLWLILDLVVFLSRFDLLVLCVRGVVLFRVEEGVGGSAGCFVAAF